MELCHVYEGRLLEPDFSTDKKVRLSVLMRHMQQSGSDQLALRGITYDRIKSESGVFLMIRHELHKTENTAELGEFTITTWPHYTGGALFFRHYEINQKGRLLAECSTAWALVNPQTRRMMRPGAFPLGPLHCERAVSFGDPARLSLPETPLHLGSTMVRYSLLDINGHVNNTIYADFLLDCVKQLYPGANIKGQAIAFCGEALIGDEISFYASGDGGALKNDGVLYMRGNIGRRRCFEAAAFLERG